MEKCEKTFVFKGRFDDQIKVNCVSGGQELRKCVWDEATGIDRSSENPFRQFSHFTPNFRQRVLKMPG